MASSKRDEEGVGEPIRLFRPYRSTYRDKIAYITYRQLDFPGGEKWVIIGNGQIESIQEGTNVSIDYTDPSNPIINSTSVGGGASDHNSLTNIGTQTHEQLEAAISLNTAKETNVTHPLVETAVPTGALFTDTDTITTLGLVGNILTYLDEIGVSTSIDLSLYLDDTILSRLISGVYDDLTDTIIFTRDDASTFSVDSSAFSGAGGDMLAANNLSDLASAATSRNNLGLGSIDNTSDANKPISTATQSALNGKASSLGSDDNYVTDAEKTVVGNTSGTNSGDQDISGIGTNASAIGNKQDILSEGAFVDGDKSKLNGIEISADVTDTANVTGAGALMDSEVTNLPDVKSFDPTDYATSAQGDKADSAEQSANKQNSLATDGTGTKMPTVDAVNARLGKLSLDADAFPTFDTAVVLSDLNLIITDLEALPVTASISGTITTSTMTPGVYTMAVSTINGTLTLDGTGVPDAVFVFRSSGGISLGASASVVLVNVLPENVHFLATGAFPLGAGCVMNGNMISKTGAPSLGAGCTVVGRMLTLAGQVSSDSSNLTLPTGTSFNIDYRSCEEMIMFTGTTPAASTGGAASFYEGGIASHTGSVTGFLLASGTFTIYPSGSSTPSQNNYLPFETAGATTFGDLNLTINVYPTVDTDISGFLATGIAVDYSFKLRNRGTADLTVKKIDSNSDNANKIAIANDIILKPYQSREFVRSDAALNMWLANGNN
jgi:hypothetical protein